MTLSQLRYFCTASRHHSITKAAQELHVTQPTISLAIRELENEFNLTLFSREGNRLELTAQGELFYRKASLLLQYCTEIQTEFTTIGRSRPPLKIGIPPMLSTIFFPDLLNAFSAEYPDIPVELDEFASVRACELVQNDRLDLALANMELYNIDKFSNCLLSTDQLVYCVSPEHPRAGQTFMRMEDFARENLLLFNSDSVQIQLLKDRFQRLMIHPRVIMRSSQLYTLLKFVRQGNCGCFLFSSMLPQFPEYIGLPLDPPLTVEIGIVWKKGRYVSNEMRQFINFTQKNFASLFGNR